MPVRQSMGPVTVGADPYVQKDRQKAVFDGVLTDEGVLPIQVFLLNEGDRRFLVRASTITLTFPDGTQIGPAGATAAAAKMESTGGVIGWTIGFGLVGYLAASSAEDKARAARLADYKSKELQDAMLGKDGSAHGFIYFVPPSGTAPFTEATLTVQFMDNEDFTSLAVRLPLTGLHFKAVPANQEEGGDPTAR
jgi:hypothetical protein